MTILRMDDLSAMQKKVTMVDGGFDPLHVGHIEYFKEAARLGLPVLCCLASDSYVSTKHKPLLPQAQRVVVIDAIRHIDYVVINVTTTAKVLECLQPRYYVKGEDWKGRLPAEESAVCLDCGIEVVYLDTMIDSSSRLLREYLTT